MAKLCVCLYNNAYPSAHKGFFQSLYVCLFAYNMCVCVYSDRWTGGIPLSGGG